MRHLNAVVRDAIAEGHPSSDGVRGVNKVPNRAGLAEISLQFPSLYTFQPRPTGANLLFDAERILAVAVQRAREPDTTSWALEIAASSAMSVTPQPSTMMAQILIPRGRSAVLPCRYVIGNVIYHMPLLLRLPRRRGEGSRHRQNGVNVSFPP
jgi:hypothetical protein